MNKKDFVIALLNMYREKYLEEEDIDTKYLYDEDVIGCQIKRYLFILTSEEDESFDKRYQDFLDSYKKLTKEQQEYCDNDFKRLMKVREKNKVKKKGMINYE